VISLWSVREEKGLLQGMKGGGKHFMFFHALETLYLGGGEGRYSVTNNFCRDA